ncbi:DUF1189 family protein [Patescibacteria group bacterium]|nr:DUF1189 family protein [Patescibacteria group bacterium]
MNFWSTIKNSIYNPLFYAELSSYPIRRSLRYFFTLIAALAFLLAFVFGAEISQIFSAARMAALSALYPRQLVIQGADGAISANISQPYFIKIASSTYSGGRANIAVIDTTRDFSLNLFNQYNSTFWLGRDFFAVAKDRNQTQVTDLGRVPDFYVDQTRVAGLANWIAGHHLAFSFIVFILFLVAFIVFFAFKLVWLIVMAFLVWSVARLKHAKFSYGHSYQIALHAATLPLILQTLFLFGGILSPFPFCYSLILLLVVFVNVF